MLQYEKSSPSKLSLSYYKQQICISEAIFHIKRGQCPNTCAAEREKERGKCGVKVRARAEEQGVRVGSMGEFPREFI